MPAELEGLRCHLQFWDVSMWINHNWCLKKEKEIEGECGTNCCASAEGLISFIFPEELHVNVIIIKALISLHDVSRGTLTRLIVPKLWRPLGNCVLNPMFTASCKKKKKKQHCPTAKTASVAVST